MDQFSPEDIELLLDKLAKGDRFALSRCITITESKNESHQRIAQQILKKLPSVKKSTFRIAISGSPGVGKSTFIEQMGLYLIKKGHKVAVLAVDPSSTISKGSILGDKTRMQELGRNENAFIRPSPTGTTLGGVTERTKESILLCEATGYDIILVETVGVGQSEYYASKLVDFFILLIQPGAGDALQGIKRGIVEMADLIAVNKSDGDQKKLALQTYRQYKQSLHLYSPKANGWVTNIFQTSSTDKIGFSEIWEAILDFKSKVSLKQKQANRTNQDIIWIQEKLSDWILQRYIYSPSIKDAIKAISKQIKANEITTYAALHKMKILIKKNGNK